MDARAVAKDLIGRNLMVPDGDGKSSRSERIPGFDRMRVYHLSAAILSAGGE